jgi:hypothetical protein
VEIICASCGQPTPAGAILCPRCDVNDAKGVQPELLRGQRADARAGKLAVIASVIFAVGFPSFAILLGVFGIHRLSRVPAGVPGIVLWRWLGIVIVVLIAAFWGALRRVFAA